MPRPEIGNTGPAADLGRERDEVRERRRCEEIDNAAS